MGKNIGFVPVSDPNPNSITKGGLRYFPATSIFPGNNSKQVVIRLGNFTQIS